MTKSKSPSAYEFDEEHTKTHLDIQSYSEGLSKDEFMSILEYYIFCIRTEQMQGLSFSPEQDGKDFIFDPNPKESFFLGGSSHVSHPSDTPVLKLYGRIRHSPTGSLKLFYGFPIFITKKRSVIPIFYTEVSINQETATIYIEQDVPEFNEAIFREWSFSFEEIQKLREEIGEDAFIRRLEKACALLNIGTENISQTLDQKNLSVFPRETILNKAIYFTLPSRVPTYGMIKELKELEKTKNFEASERTALNLLLSNKIDEYADLDDPDLAIFPMDQSQYEALKRSFSHSLTVVTGPPGTGKSQVVLNLIANAAYRGKKVLFASKNNHAINVIIDKLDEILVPNPVIRLGERSYRRKAYRKIGELIRNRQLLKKEISLEKELLELQTAKERVKNINSIIEEMKKVNQELERIENSLYNVLLQMPTEIVACDSLDFIRNIDIRGLSEARIYFKRSISFLNRILRFIFRTKYQQKDALMWRLVETSLPNNIWIFFKQHTPELRSKINMIDWACTELPQLQGLYYKKLKLKNQIDSFPTLSELYDIFRENSNIVNRTSGVILRNTWFNRIGSLSAEDAKPFLQYAPVSEQTEEEYTENDRSWRMMIEERNEDFMQMLKILPIWVTTNLSAKNSIPFEPALFDLIVIDEASQCDIPSVIPLLFRGRQAIIIGDPYQLRHVSTLSLKDDFKAAQDSRTQHLNYKWSYRNISLYDCMEQIYLQEGYDPVLLDNHYRSHPDIIQFSNEYFYNGRLQIATRVSEACKRLRNHSKVIEWLDVIGETKGAGSKYNEKEVSEVVRVITELMKEKEIQSNEFSLGIVTPFKAQVELIEQELKKKFPNNPMTIGTSHSFQGDQKDIIIFSTVIAVNTPQATVDWVNTFTKNLVNVAVTRPRSYLIIIGDKKRCLAAGGVLGGLVEYIKSVEESQEERLMDSTAEKTLYKSLIEHDLHVRPQLEVKVENKVYRLDFALYQKGKRFDLEVDGRKVHDRNLYRDLLRDLHLQQAGWIVRRYDAQKVLENTQDVVDDILRLC